MLACGYHHTHPLLRTDAAGEGAHSSESLRHLADCPLLLLHPTLESAHDAGEVQAPGQCVQEHLILLDTLHEFLQGQLPWWKERRSWKENLTSEARTTPPQLHQHWRKQLKSGAGKASSCGVGEKFLKKHSGGVEQGGKGGVPASHPFLSCLSIPGTPIS